MDAAGRLALTILVGQLGPVARFAGVGWDVGGVRITRVVEFAMPLGIEFFAEATPADVAAQDRPRNPG